ncbi:MAG: calcium-binding protein [Pseudomonadota bacterium]
MPNPWFGNGNANTIFATWDVYNSDAPGPEVRGNGGNDYIIRDWTGYYEQDGSGDWMDMDIKGGNGTDTVSYASAISGVSADLQSVFGYGLASTPGTDLGVDRLYHIENLFGSHYNDILHGSSTNNYMLGLNGNDDMFGDAGHDTLFGDLGNDTVSGGNGNDSVYGGHGHDVLLGGFGADTIFGGNHNDELDGGFHNDLLDGGNGSDTIDGGRGNDTIEAGDGHDDIDAGAHHDTVTLGDGADTVDLGRGSDTVYVSGFGNNTIDGGAGNDTAVYDTNLDVNVNLLFAVADRGVDGTDVIVNIENVETSGGDDTVLGTGGDNYVDVNNGHDFVRTYSGDDTVYGGSGNDDIGGGNGEDLIVAGFGHDTVFAGNHDDVVNGGSGQDEIRGGEGADTLTGGSFGDTFVYDTGDVGIDTITDFNVNQDTILFKEDFLVEDHLGNVHLDDALMVWNEGGHALLAAHTQADGWQFIARFNNVTANELQAEVIAGDAFDVEGQIDGIISLGMAGADQMELLA